MALDVTELVGALKATLARQGSEEHKEAGSQKRQGGGAHRLGVKSPKFSLQGKVQDSREMGWGKHGARENVRTQSMENKHGLWW